MKFDQIKQIYPEAQLVHEPKNTNVTVSFPFKDQWIQFNAATKTNRELDLLQLMFKPEQAPLQHAAKQSDWYAFLLGERNELPEKTGDFRVIQFAILKKDQHFDQKTWLKAFKSMFESVDEAFFIDETAGLLIQSESAGKLTVEELSAIIQTLDDDFSIKTICYIGQFWPFNSDFRSIIMEEQIIFNKQKNKTSALFSLPTVALNYYTAEALEKSPLMQALKKKFIGQPEWKELVLAMWHSQGNISLAAKSLYVHRNTLQYRIDRFYELSGLSLRDMNDLLLCYLLLL